MKHFLLIFLLVLQLPLLAQDKADTAFVFHFVPRSDVFYVPFKENHPELERLCSILNAHKELLQSGKMYISVSSYAASGSADMSAARMAYMRSNRVKSELITRAGVKESYFVTDRRIVDPYHDERNVVVVVVPASITKVAQIAGVEAAAKVAAYLEEVAANIPEARQAAEAKSLAERETREVAKREETVHCAQEQALPQAQATARPYTLALRANLLRWATLTPDLGVEWRINRNWSILVDGAWTAWSWNSHNRRYALWEVSPAIHYNIGKEKRGYVGGMYHIGQFNYKLSHTGKQGDLQGGGIVGGYRLPIGKRLMLDFNLGVGYTRAHYQKYTVTDGVRVRQGNEVKNYWGINKAGVTLVFLMKNFLNEE